MGNVLGTVATALIVQQALDLVFTKRPMLNEISLDLKGEQCKFGQQVISRVHGIPDVQNFRGAATEKADTDVAITLNKFKQVRYSFTAEEISSTDRNLVMEVAEPMAIAIGNHMVDAIAALWTEANFGAGAQSTTAAVAGTDYETLTTLREALITRGANGQRFAAVNAAVYKKLLNDPTVIEDQKNPGNGVIPSGVLPGVAGFSGIYEYPALPTTGNMTGFAGTKDSAVLATRVPKDPREVLQGVPFNGRLGVVTNPRNGFSVMVIESISEELDIDVRLVWMYGEGVGNDNNGQILKSA